MAGNYENLTVNSTRELPRVERFIEELLDYYNIPGAYFGNILLAVTEAVQLGLRGGRCVTIRISKSSNGISFGISRDKNPLGDLDEIDRAIATKAIARETFIIRSLADKAELKDEARTLELHFHISGISPERALIRSEKVREYLIRKEKVMDRNE